MKIPIPRPTEWPGLSYLAVLAALASFTAMIQAEDPPPPRLEFQQVKDALKGLGLEPINRIGTFSRKEGPETLGRGEVQTISRVELDRNEELAGRAYEGNLNSFKNNGSRVEEFDAGGPVKGHVFALEIDDDFANENVVGGCKVFAIHRVRNAFIIVEQSRGAKYTDNALAARQAVRQKLMQDAQKDLKERVRKIAQALSNPSERPTLALDRLEGSPGAPLRISASKGFKPGKGTVAPEKVIIYWDDLVLEDECRVDTEGRIAVLPQRDERRSAPWLWLFIPKNAKDGEHRIRAVQEKTGLQTDTVTVRVYRPTMKQLADDFDAILERYKKDIPANPDSTNGYTWNISRAAAGPAFKCGDYQNKVLHFLTGLLFNEDPAVRRLMDGFDFGPLMSGPTEIRFTHHFVVIWPRGQEWPKSGVFMDPWGIQRPQALVLRPDAPPETSWWRPCYQYQPEFKGRGLFIDRTAFAEYTSTPRADTLTAPGVHYPTHTDNPEFHYSDFVHGKKALDVPLPNGPAIPTTRVTVHCPVNVLVVDRQTGKRLGTADGTTVIEEIPNGFCEVGEANGAKHWRIGLPAGDFDVKITPYRDGEFRAAVIRSENETLSEFPLVAVTLGQMGEFSVANGEASALTTSDGRKFTAVARSLVEPSESGSESGPVPRSNSTAWIIGVSVATVLFLSIGVLLARRFRHVRVA